MIELAVGAANDRFRAQRHVERRVAASIETREARLDHANDLERIPIEWKLSAGGFFIAGELALEEGVAEHHHTGTPALVVLANNRPADDGAYAKSLEVVAADPARVDAPHLAAVRQIELPLTARVHA